MATKILAAEEEYLTNFGKQQGVAALKGMLKARPAVAALKGQQTQDTAPPKKGEGADQELSDEDLAVLKATGISQEAFLKSVTRLGNQLRCFPGPPGVPLLERF